MNEVKVTPIALTPVARVASSTSTESTESAESTNTKIIAAGNELPPKEDINVAVHVAPKEVQAKTEQAVKEVNQFVQSVQRDLHFSVDEDSGLTIIRVRDKESGELIRQIPEDIFLNLAQKLKDNQGFQLLDTHG